MAYFLRKEPRGLPRPARTSVRKNVLDHLRSEILSGALNHGERLVETDIARMLNVSRTPVREAFRALEIEGLVTHELNRGITVSRLPDDIGDIYALRGVLEGLAARMAAERRTANDISSLRRLVKQMAQAYRRHDYKTAVRLHTEFNMRIYQCAQSRRLYELGERFNEYTERSQWRSLSVAGRCEAIEQEHNRIVKALERRDAKAAEAAVRSHVENAREAYLQSLETWGA
jgi:DNA-binding GntR family transcriptional regulator